MFFDLFVFAITNYILGFLSATIVGAICGASMPEEDPFVMQRHTRMLTAKMYLPILICVTLIRLRFMGLNIEESLKYLTIGTVGTMMLRETVSSFVIASVGYVAKKKTN